MEKSAKQTIDFSTSGLKPGVKPSLSGRGSFKSRICRHFTQSYNPGFRAEFRKEFVLGEEIKLEENHSHPQAAAKRARADYAMQSFIRRQGYEPYNVSFSKRSNEVGMQGDFMARDLEYPCKVDKLTEKHVMVMVDVDYYVDMPKFVRYGRPILMYTWRPEKAGGTTENGYYYMEKGMEHDVVRYHIDGGASYRHGIWDYDHDWISVDHGKHRWHCSVELIELEEGRRIVCVTPEYRELTWLWPVPSTVLRRVVYVHNGISLVVSSSSAGRVFSFANTGSPVAVTLEEDIFMASWIRYDASPKMCISDVERVLGKRNALGEHLAPLLYQLLGGLGKVKPDFVRTRGSPPRCYVPVLKEPTIIEEIKPVGRRIAEPLVIAEAEAFTPAKGLDSEMAAVDGRVVKMRNDAIPKGIYSKWAAEFVAKVVPTPGTGCPRQLWEVLKKQSTAQQRARNERWIGACRTYPKLTVQAFVKQESYSAINDPRVISAVNTPYQLEMSTYAHAFKNNIMNKLGWYMPGKSPVEVTDRVVSISKTKLVETDFSRFDGTISKWLRINVEQAAYLRWISPVFRGNLSYLLRQEIGAKCYTTKGYKYVTEAQRLSGSPLTTDGNTLVNAFVTYAAHRKNGLSTHESWEKLGAYAGDDGLAEVDLQSLQAVSKELGLRLDARPVENDYVTFLGRIFYNPLTGNAGSIQDPDRTLRKLHVSYSSATPISALQAKATGYLCLDPQAPIVSTWCRKVLALTGPVTGELSMEDLPWYVRDRGEMVAWPQLSYPNGNELVARLLDTTTTEVGLWCDKIQQAKSLDELSGIVVLRRQPAKISAWEYGGTAQVPVEKKTVTQDQKEVVVPEIIPSTTAGPSKDSKVVLTQGGQRRTAARLPRQVGAKPKKIRGA